ncbi:MAG: hypothetical protein R3B13_36900 [Polyangiaceae bacterium]
MCLPGIAAAGIGLSTVAAAQSQPRRPTLTLAPSQTFELALQARGGSAHDRGGAAREQRNSASEQSGAAREQRNSASEQSGAAREQRNSASEQSGAARKQGNAASGKSGSPSSHALERAPSLPVPVEFRRALVRAQLALSPVCRRHCGTTRLIRDDAMQAAGEMRPRRNYTLLAVNPPAAESWRFAFGHDAPLLVVAHEYGHHLDYVNRLGGVSSGDPWRQELMADVIAGCVLARAGVPRRNVIRGSRRVAHLAFDHYWERPHGADMVAALDSGYRRCRGDTPTLAALVRDTRASWDMTRPGPLRPPRAASPWL